MKRSLIKPRIVENGMQMQYRADSPWVYIDNILVNNHSATEVVVDVYWTYDGQDPMDSNKVAWKIHVAPGDIYVLFTNQTIQQGDMIYTDVDDKDGCLTIYGSGCLLDQE